MKFKPEGEPFPLEQRDCQEDYDRARELGRVRLGARALYYPRLTWVGVLPLDQVERAYLRIEDIPVGMGCRRVPVGQHYLMAGRRKKRPSRTGRRGTGPWRSWPGWRPISKSAMQRRRAGSRPTCKGQWFVPAPKK